MADVNSLPPLGPHHRLAVFLTAVLLAGGYVAAFSAVAGCVCVRVSVYVHLFASHARIPPPIIRTSYSSTLSSPRNDQARVRGVLPSRTPEGVFNPYLFPTPLPLFLSP